MKTHFGTVNCKNKVDIIKKSKKILGLSLKSYVESEYDNLHEVHSLRDHAFGHGLSANFELKSGMLHGHAISVEMCLTTFISYKLGWLSEIEMYRIFKLFSTYELSLWHDILTDKDCMIEGYEKILQKRGGNLAIPVPIGIGKCGYINDLSKKQLLNYIDEYKTVVTKYPRNGKGKEPLCVDAGLEEPLAIYNRKTNNIVSAKIN